MRAESSILQARVFLLPSFLVLAALSAAAHHSTAEYDLTRPASVTGLVTHFQWSNPHAHIYLDATKPGGAIVHWTIDIASPNELTRMGWTTDSLKPGDKVTCSGARAKDGSPRMRCTLVALEDGKLLQSN